MILLEIWVSFTSFLHPGYVLPAPEWITTNSAWLCSTVLMYYSWILAVMYRGWLWHCVTVSYSAYVPHWTGGVVIKVLRALVYIPHYLALIQYWSSIGPVTKFLRRQILLWGLAPSSVMLFIHVMNFAINRQSATLAALHICYHNMPRIDLTISRHSLWPHLT